jgi:hypothetical protein
VPLDGRADDVFDPASFDVRLADEGLGLKIVQSDGEGGVPHTVTVDAGRPSGTLFVAAVRKRPTPNRDSTFAAGSASIEGDERICAMKIARTLTLLAVAAGVTAGTVGTPAEAKTGAASATTKATTAAQAVRYVSLGSCTKKDYSVPCGSWELHFRSGAPVKLSEATVFPLNAKGKPDKEASAPIAVSDDGRRVVYFRKSDHKLVWKNVGGGRSHSLPGKAAKVPKGLGMGDVDPLLSPDGDVVVLDYNDDTGKRPTLVVDLGSGDVAKLPGGDSVQGFSPDGRRVLVSHYTADNTTEFVVYGTDGGREESREVPQVVSNNSPVALADDGVTVGVVIVPSSGKPRLRQYDLSTDSVSPAVDLPIPGGDTAYRLAWDGSGKLTFWHIHSNADGNVSRATASRVDPSTGHLKKIDSFKVKSRLWTWWLPGE